VVRPEHPDFTTEAQRHGDERDSGPSSPMQNNEEPEMSPSPIVTLKGKAFATTNPSYPHPTDL
jgi:hypothetical protein